MKKKICISLLTALVLLFNSDQATAQCGQSGNNNAYCHALSYSTGTPEYAHDYWTATGNLLYITVYMEAFNQGGPPYDEYAFAEVVVTGAVVFSKTVYEGNYEDYFTAPITAGYDFDLFAYAQSGESYLQADW